MDELENVLDALSKELLAQVKDVSKCKDRNQRRVQAETVQLLSQSLSALIDSTSMAAAEMQGYDDGMMDDMFLD